MRQVRDRPDGRRTRVAERTIYDWLKAYDARGVSALGRNPHRDRGVRKHHVSKAWDEAVPFDDAGKARVAADLECHVRSLWAATTKPGATFLKRPAESKLMELTEKAGCKGNARELRNICRLSRRSVERGRAWRTVAIHDRDAKQWADKHKPRIRRTREDGGPWRLSFATCTPWTCSCRASRAAPSPPSWLRPRIGRQTARSFIQSSCRRARASGKSTSLKRISP